MFSYLINLFTYKKRVCKICNYPIKFDEKVFACKKCPNKMHKSCFLNKNGLRGFCGCPNCNVIKGILVNKN